MTSTGNQIFLARYMLGVDTKKAAYRKSHQVRDPVPVLDVLVKAELQAPYSELTAVLGFGPNASHADMLTYAMGLQAEDLAGRYHRLAETPAIIQTTIDSLLCIRRR